VRGRTAAGMMRAWRGSWSDANRHESLPRAHVESFVPADSGNPRQVFLACARVLAGPGDLAGRMGEFAGVAATAGGGPAVVYLFDDDTDVLVPVAASGVDVSAISPLAPGGDPADGSLAAAQSRSTCVVVRGKDGDPRSALLAADRSLTCSVHLPLVLHDSAGDADVEGILAIGLAGGQPGPRRIELLEGIASVAAAVAHRARLESALTERSDWLDRLAHTDALTGLANRRTLDRVLELELVRSARQGTAVCVAIFQVDRHGSISEAHGAHVGDDVLRRVASTLSETVRLVDTVARYGRDQFVVVGPGAAGVVMAQRVAGAVRRLEVVPGEGPVTVSVGIARFPEDGGSATELLTAAEAALQDARRKGAGTILAASGA